MGSAGWLVAASCNNNDGRGAEAEEEEEEEKLVGGMRGCVVNKQRHGISGYAILRQPRDGGWGPWGEMMVW